MKKEKRGQLLQSKVCASSGRRRVGGGRLAFLRLPGGGLVKGGWTFLAMLLAGSRPQVGIPTSRARKKKSWSWALRCQRKMASQLDTFGSTAAALFATLYPWKSPGTLAALSLVCVQYLKRIGKEVSSNTAAALQNSIKMGA